MDYDEEEVDSAALALLSQGIWDEDEDGARAWKGYPWEVTNRLYGKGYINDPRR